MREFLIGNVIRNKKNKDLYVVTECDDKRATFIPFDYTNATCGGAFEKTFRNDICGCHIGQRSPDPDCNDCKGTGYVKVQNCWMGDYKLEAETIKEFIIKSLTKKFEF